MNTYPSSSSDKFILRFPEPGTRQMLKARAALNRRSLNSEILHLIEIGLKASSPSAHEAEK